MNSDLDALASTITDLADRLAGVRGLVADLQEQADRGGMFQHISPEWKHRYLDALHRLAAVRTRQRELEVALDIAKKQRDGMLATLRQVEQLTKAAVAQ